MATLSDLAEQATEIKNLTYKIQDLLTSYTVVQFFRQNPERTQQILDSTEGVRSSRLVLYGLAERLNSAVLPLREDLIQRTHDWLEPGDIIVGWQGALIGNPRVIKGLGDSGYSWRYYDEDESVERNPVMLDRYFQHIGWEKLGVDLDLDAIFDIQQTEVESLTDQLDYFSGREFLNS